MKKITLIFCVVISIPTQVKKFQKAVFLLQLFLAFNVTASGEDVIQNEHVKDQTKVSTSEAATAGFAQARTFGIWQAPESLQNRPEFQATNTATQVVQVAVSGAGVYTPAVKGTTAAVDFVARKVTDIARTAVLATTLTTTTLTQRCPGNCLTPQEIIIRLRSITPEVIQSVSNVAQNLKITPAAAQILGSNIVNQLNKNAGQILNRSELQYIAKYLYETAVTSAPQILKKDDFWLALRTLLK